MASDHKNCISRKKTYKEQTIILIPVEKAIRNIINNGISNKAFVNCTSTKAIKINNGTKEMPRLIADDNTFDIGKIYLGIYTLLIKLALFTIDSNPCDVASEK